MKEIKLLCLIMIISALTACGLDNTMYNARNYFKSAQAKPLNTNGRPNAQAIDEYTKCIQKCGIIISESKKGARLDDAVFLMAKALYYKGNSAFQAKDQFENLIKGFPKSPYVAESHIYIAKILREINQPNDAETRLDEFIRNPEFRKFHAQALLVLADFAIKDKDYSQAQFWLDKIIREHPKTREFREAYFLFGRNYYEQKDYAASREAFVKMRSARRIDKAMKLDAGYYVALNDLYLGETDRAFSEARKLLKTETRPEKLSSVRTLLGRILMARGEQEKGREELETVTKNYPRTEAAAAAYYYLGEYFYYQKSDIDNAITNYNRVRTEFSTSEYASTGQSKATALNNVKPSSALNSETALSQFLDYYYLAAESFASALALPDSAVASYRRVISERDSLVSLRDSLGTAMAMEQVILDSLMLVAEDSLQMNAIDSLSVEPDASEVPVTEMADSLNIPSIALADTMMVSEPAAVDSLTGFEPQLTDNMSDDELVVADSLLIPEAAISDSLLTLEPGDIDSLMAVGDSLATEPEPQESAEKNPDIAQQKEQSQTRIKALEGRIELIGETIDRFDKEIIPFCLFAIGSMRHSADPEHPDSQATLDTLQGQYPGSKYTKAYKALLAGQPVRLVDPLIEEQEAALDSLLGIISTQPDSALVGLERLRGSPVPEVQLAANYRLGWYYSFEVEDTLAAKPYLQEVLDNSDSGEYGTTVRRFYDGNRYLLWGPEVIADTLKAPLDSLQLAIPDSLESMPAVDFAPGDSLQFEPTELDSLDQMYQIPTADSLADSLQVEVPEEDKPSEAEAGMQKPEEPAPEASPEAIKEEEPKLE